MNVLTWPQLILFQGLINVDYESEVEDDMLSIFRKGEVGAGLLSSSGSVNGRVH